MQYFKTAISAYKADPSFETAEAMLWSIRTRGQAQIAYEALDDAGYNSSRIVGRHVADNADEAAYHPNESSGAAYVLLEDGFTIFAQWSDAGFWDVDFPTEHNAKMEIEAMNDEYGEED